MARFEHLGGSGQPFSMIQGQSWKGAQGPTYPVIVFHRWGTWGPRGLGDAVKVPRLDPGPGSSCPLLCLGLFVQYGQVASFPQPSPTHASPFLVTLRVAFLIFSFKHIFFIYFIFTSRIFISFWACSFFFEKFAIFSSVYLKIYFLLYFKNIFFILKQFWSYRKPARILQRTGILLALRNSLLLTSYIHLLDVS